MIINFNLLPLTLILYGVSAEHKQERYGKRKHERFDNTLWKKEYENELEEAMIKPNKAMNITRNVQSATSDNEAVIEKLMETITASENYLKKTEGIDFRLNRLDIEVHEKTDTILKRLTEITSAIENLSYSETLETFFGPLKADVEQIKLMLENKKYPLSKDSNGTCVRYKFFYHKFLNFKSHNKNTRLIKIIATNHSYF